MYDLHREKRRRGGPGVSLTLCCFVFYSTRLFVLSLVLCCFVLVFYSPFSIAITSLGEERGNLSAFRTFVRFALVWFCLFLSSSCLVRAAACVTFFVIVALPGLFSHLFSSVITRLFGFRGNKRK